MKKNVLFFAVFLFSMNLFAQKTDIEKQQYFEPTSESLMHYQVPQWYNDAKFGIYFHWAPFSVAAYKSEWYPKWMYWPADQKAPGDMGEVREHHIKTWGSLDKFGYKDFFQKTLFQTAIL